jgi:hypothetical protein
VARRVSVQRKVRREAVDDRFYRVDEVVEKWEEVEALSPSSRSQLEEGAEWREALAAYRDWSRMLRAAGRDQEALDVADRATAVSIRTLAWRS